MALLPSFVLAAWARAFTVHAVGCGKKILAECSTPVRVLAGTATPFSSLDVDIGGECVTVEAVPWLAWFRSSIYSSALANSDLIDLSRRFSSSVRLRVIIPAGPPLPLSLYPGVLSDTTGDVLEWLIRRYL